MPINKSINSKPLYGVEIKEGKVVKVDKLNDDSRDNSSNLKKTSSVSISNVTQGDTTVIKAKLSSYGDDSKSLSQPIRKLAKPEPNFTIGSKPMSNLKSTKGLSDLEVFSVSISDITGSDITYSYEIDNIGSVDITTSFTNGIYLSTNTVISSSDYQIATWTHSSGVLAKNYYTSDDLTTTVSGVPNGYYYLGVIADINNDITESNELNNSNYASSPQVEISSYLSDLTVYSVSVSDAIGPDITYSYEIDNIGSVDVTNSFTNGIYLSTNTIISSSDYQIATWSHSSGVLANSYYTSDDLMTTVSGVPDGYYYLGVIADINDDVTESSELNNSNYASSPQVEISSNLPDLTVNSVSVTDVTGSDITYSYEIDNLGSVDVTNSFTNGIYLSTNTIISSSDYQIATWSHSSGVLANSYYTSDDLMTTVSGVPDGYYYLGVIADINNDVTEMDKSNNTNYTYFGYVSIPEFYINNDIKLYPNPVSDKLIIEFDNQNISYNLEIINTTGQVILNKKITNSVEQVDLSGQSAGVYFVKLQSENNTIVKKVIKQK